jgi:hypothetical protein
MAAGDIGRQVVYHEDGAHVCWVSDYVAGRDAGDHFLVGFFNAEATDAGRGNVIQTWSVYRSTGENGTFSWHGDTIVPEPPTEEIPPDWKPEHPIVLPPLEIWGGKPPEYVDIGGPGDQPHPDQGLPGDQPYPDHGLPLPPLDIWHDPILPPDKPDEPIIWPPGIWGGKPPEYIDIGGPGDQPGIWGGRPPEYIDISPPAFQPNVLPTFNPADAPDHPELPNLNAGFWAWLKTSDDALTWGFVTAPLSVEHPINDPQYPETGTPGTWLVTAVAGRWTWAWVPDEAPHVEHHG